MLKKLICVIPHSHSWLWTQTCVSSMKRNPPKADGYEVKVIVVDNSPWSPAIRGVTDTVLGDGIIVVPNHKSNKFHASALDCIVETLNFDLLMALETDVMFLRPDWLQWFVDQLKWNDYAVGAWHHEQFVNPSCTLYRASVLYDMLEWCRHGSLYKVSAPKDVLRWGPLFEKSQDITARQPERDYQGWYDDNISWIAGPFAEKRGWPQGTVLKEKPSGQDKGPGWYEPSQQLHHWAVEAGFTYTVCPSLTTKNNADMPIQTLYGATIADPGRQLEAIEMFGNAETVHLWGGTRALDIIKHDVTCNFVKSNTPAWLAREARFWKAVVSLDVQAQTLDLIREHGWHITGQGQDHVSERDREAAAFVRRCYAEGGVEW